MARVRFKEQPVWLVTSYAAVRDVLRDQRFSTNPERPGFPTGSTAPRPQPDPTAKRKARGFLTMDEPEHGQYRRMLLPTFSARRIEAFRPRVEGIIEELIDAMTAAEATGESGATSTSAGAASGGVDFVQSFALPLSSRVICELLGVPYEGAAFFQEKSAVAMDPERAPEERMGAAAEFNAYLAEVIAAKHREPGDDLLSRLIADQVDTGAIDDEELAATAMALLIAGYETTTQMIALGVVSLAEDRDSYELLRKDPQAAPAVVEELLRFWTVAHQGLYRTAVEDVEVHGTTIRAGEGVILSVAAADREPGVFPAPDDFAPGRAPRANLAFGHGAHRCLGEPLARLELETALRRLAERLPGLRSAMPVAELPFRKQHFIYGVSRLPVTW